MGLQQMGLPSLCSRILPLPSLPWPVEVVGQPCQDQAVRAVLGGHSSRSPVGSWGDIAGLW